MRGLLGDYENIGKFVKIIPMCLVDELKPPVSRIKIHDLHQGLISSSEEQIIE